jgi:hypothetical protein
MARSKSKHVRLIMRRRKQWKARTKRRAEAAKSGARTVKKPTPAKKLLPTPPATPPAADPQG